MAVLIVFALMHLGYFTFCFLAYFKMAIENGQNSSLNWHIKNMIKNQIYMFEWSHEPAKLQSFLLAFCDAGRIDLCAMHQPVLLAAF